MKLYVDSANLKEIQYIMEYFPIKGVTTNPSILAREGGSPFENLVNIKKILKHDKELHVQVVGDTAEIMIQEAERILTVLGDNICIKVPVSEEGYKAMKMMNQAGMTVTATAIYTPMQALLAGMSGAKYAAPYVNRLAMIGQDGAQITGVIQNLYHQYGLKTQVLAASFKNVEQVLGVVKSGSPCVTASPDIIRQLIVHPLTDRAVSDFKLDFLSLTTEGATMLDFPDMEGGVR